jgi:hypothetical protein
MNLDEHDRRRLGELADVLIPAGDGMPSASEAGVGGTGLDAVLLARPDLVDGLKRLLAATGDAPAAEVISRLRQQDPAGFGLLAEVVPGAYFMNPQVRQRIGYSGQGPRPIDPRPDYMEDGLLESVLLRGPIYRPTPPAP